MSELEETLDFQLRAVGIRDFVREHRFYPSRMWRFDFAWPEKKIAVECEGGTWGKSRHTTGTGFEQDCIKYNTASTEGWKVLRFTGNQIKKGEAIDTICKILPTT